MPDIQLDRTTLTQAIKALSISVPIYRAFKEGTTIVIITRHGRQEWKPPRRKSRGPSKKAPEKVAT